MRKYLYCENGFVEKPQWMPNCWVNVECLGDYTKIEHNLIMCQFANLPIGKLVII